MIETLALTFSIVALMVGGIALWLHIKRILGDVGTPIETIDQWRIVKLTKGCIIINGNMEPEQFDLIRDTLKQWNDAK